MTGANLPERGPALDRSALERVLARAAELHAQESAEPGFALTDEQIVELGREVGLAPHAIRQAIAEERGKVAVPPEPGARGSVYGPSAISASRVMPGTPAAAITATDTMLRDSLGFDVSRRFPSGAQWSPKHGFFDSMRAQFARDAEGVDLRLADVVTLSATALDGERCHVRVDADVSSARRSAVWAGGGFSIASAVAAFVVGISGAPVLLAVPVLLGGSGLAVAQSRASYQRTVRKVAVALEQLLDRLEYGPARRRASIVEKLLG
jgi:hypothetical protein